VSLRLPCKIAALVTYAALSWFHVARADDNRSASRSAPAFAGERIGQVRDDNSLKMKLIWIPSGTFTMGSPADEKDRRDDEDQVQVTLTKGFWFGQREVTQSEWRRVMRTSPWTAKKLGVKEGDDYPATCVSWDAATEFCTKLNRLERQSGRIPAGWQYRLPTEAQWEFACRAGTTSRFSCGERDSVLVPFAWFDQTTAKERYAHPVAKKQANPWGLFDMHGNVYEWCRDTYARQLPGGRDPEVTTGGALRMVRGGSWVLSAESCRSAKRDWESPDERSSSIGLRIAAVQLN
jgi:formylglycine-generating enzyme